MKQLQPVIWSKGTFLTPQHLQVQDRFIEDTLRFQLQALNFRPWGFTELRIDQAKLTEGEFVISRASGMFADGLLFEVPDADPAPASKRLAEFLEPDQDEVDVFLTVPEYRARGLNVSLEQRKAGTRYLASLETFRDENTGVGERAIQVAQKNFRILFEGESREGSSSLRVANVQRTSEGTFRLNPRFVPPLLYTSANEYLYGLLRTILEITSAKSSALSATRRQKNQSLADFSSSDIANFWLLYTINSHLPILKHLFETKSCHPATLYEAEISLAGALTTFSLTTHPRDLPEYNHDELGPCFTELTEKLRALLETVVPTNFVSLPLKLAQPSIYATAVPEDKYLAGKFYLAINAETNQPDIIRKVPQLVKVCSANHIEHLVKHALMGMPLVHVPQPPSAIPIKMNYQYFSLSKSGVGWEAVERARNLAAYVPQEFPNPQLELVIVLPEAG